MKKHAYLIVANSNFKVLETSLKMIDDDRNDVFLLLDKKSKVSSLYKENLKKLCTQSPVYITEKTVNWGGYTQIDAVLKLISLANKSSNNYQYIHFFQGSDLPIKSQDQIHRFFEKNYGKEFVMIEKNRKEMAVRKTKYWHFFCHNRFFRKNKIVKCINFGLVYLQKLLHIEKHINMDVYQGSALFSITGECAKYIESQREEIRKNFRYSLAADEVFLQSILMASNYKNRIAKIDKSTSSNARLIDRTRPDGKNSPHIWRNDEFDYIIKQPEDICFARKFDEKVDFEIVDNIYKHIKGTSV